MKQPLRVGVIGVGYLGRHHARIYQELPMVSLVGVVDINRSRGTTIGQEFGVPNFENLSDLLQWMLSVWRSRHLLIILW